MRKHRRRRPSKREVVLGKLKATLSPLRAHPRRFAWFAGLCLVLFWLVLSTSLPYALAPSEPEIALALNPNNPQALIAKAEKVHAQLLAATGGQTESGLATGDANDNTVNASATPEGEGEIARLRKEVRRLAVKAIANDPLDAEAFRLLAETSDNSNDVRILMQETLKRSRRHLTALLWLLNDSYYHKDFKAALNDADLLLRTNPEVSATAFSYLTLIAEAPAGRPLLVQELTKVPAWRKSFFDALPQNVKDPNVPLELMMALQESGQPPTDKELAPYLTFLINKNSVEAAHNVWLLFLPKAERNSLGLLTHPNFEQDPSGLVFDWQIARGINALAEFLPLDGQMERGLHISFGTGRVQFPEVSQVIRLTPGRYHLEGRLRGSITAKRGLRWQVRCLSGSHRILGETDMLMGRSEDWRIFSLEADVPEAEDCRGQTLRLFHHSRSASEELISGEAWFTGLHLERVAEATVAMQ